MRKILILLLLLLSIPTFVFSLYCFEYTVHQTVILYKSVQLKRISVPLETERLCVDHNIGLLSGSASSGDYTVVHGFRSKKNREEIESFYRDVLWHEDMRVFWGGNAYGILNDYPEDSPEGILAWQINMSGMFEFGECAVLSEKSDEFSFYLVHFCSDCFLVDFYLFMFGD